MWLILEHPSCKLKPDGKGAVPEDKKYHWPEAHSNEGVNAGQISASQQRNNGGNSGPFYQVSGIRIVIQ